MEVNANLKLVETFVKELKEALESNILPYWMDKMVDTENGGFYGRIDGNEILHRDAEKGIILNTRILWTFSAAARLYNNQAYKSIADRAYAYIKTNFQDRGKGGVFWMLDAKGNPLETKKQVYAQAFAIYAFSEYYRLTENHESLDLAVSLFELLEKYTFDKEKNGYLEAFDRDWLLLDDLRLSDKDANEKKTMNTHLHILEAYTNLYRVWKKPTLKKQLHNLVRLFLDKFIDDSFHFRLFFDENWVLKSEEVSFGHDIEGSWLLCEAVEALGDADLMLETKEIAVKIVDRTISEGLDWDGGLMNEANLDGLSDTDKHWWPQAEALVGLTNAWQITRDELYLNDTIRVWDFTRKNMIDHKNGEWYWRVSRNGLVFKDEDKAGFWKCPYHNGRAMMEVVQRLTNH